MKKLFSRVLSFLLVLTLLSTDIFAVVKEVKVGGAYSINDLGQSDNKVSMKELKDDYSDYKQTDWLTEYFHKDSSTSTKVDLNEAVSWLVDNEIINRDRQIIVENIYPADSKDKGTPPTITIKKDNLAERMSDRVTLSAGLLMLYKAVYGSKDARAFGVEVPNTRVDNGVKEVLWKIMNNHEYFIRNSESTINQFNSNGHSGDGGNGGSGAKGGSSGTGGAGGAGGTAGTGSISQTTVSTVDTKTSWRYTPQGDEYESIFGDTNIFISDVNISQSVDAGQGGAGGAGGSGGTGNGASPGGTGYGGGGGAGGGGGSAGSGQNAIQYETDYKQIYYVPGADLLLYRVSDCLELYIQEALSKGLIQTSDLKGGVTEKFRNVFMNTEDTTVTSLQNPWSSDAPAYIVNRVVSKLNSTIQVRNTRDERYRFCSFFNIANAQHNVLGDNYVVSWDEGAPSTLTITRTDLFNNRSGYFASEKMTKMEFYRYIYSFIGPSEKKMSDLEVDIINYKYGMQIDNLGTESDVYILKYLIALGVLDYTSVDDFQNLDETMSAGEFCTILYRVANKNARLDFSKIQLTDSEAQWQAQGFKSQSLALTTSDTMGDPYVYSSTEDEEIGPVDEEPLASYSYDLEGNALPLSGSADLINKVVTEESSDGVVKVKLEARDWANSKVVEGQSSPIGQVMLHGLNYSFRGAYVSDKSNGGTAHPFAPASLPYQKDTLHAAPGVSLESKVDKNGAPDNYIENILDYYLAEFLDDRDFLNYWGGNSDREGFSNTLSGPRAWKSGLQGSAREKAIEETLKNGGNSVDLKSPFDGVPYYDCFYYFCNNIYVIAMLKNNPDLYNRVMKMLDESKYNPGGNSWWGNVVNFFTGKSYRMNAYNQVVNDIKGELRRYVEGDDAPTSIRFYVDPTTTVYGNGDPGRNVDNYYNYAQQIVPGNTYYSFLHTVGTLSRIEVVYKDGDVTQEWNIQREGPLYQTLQSFGSTSNAGTAQKVWEMGDNTAFTYNLSTNTGTEETALNAFYKAINRADYKWSEDLGSCINVQTPSSDSQFGGFISWASIKAMSAYGVNIEQIGDCILHNVDTDTYAYFPTEKSSYKYALVGTQLVSGDPDEGVAKKVNGQQYYWFDTIRLLVGTTSESAILNGIKGITLPYWSVQQHTKRVPVISEGGFQQIGFDAIRLRLGPQSATPAVGTDGRAYFMHQGMNTDPLTGIEYFWANYVAASTANRGLNMVSRKVQYSDGNTKKVAYAVVFLKPTNLSSTAPVKPKMSLEQTLDAVAQPPTEPKALAQWESNKILCNDYLNWIYGTGKNGAFEYISTGYLVPEVFIFAENTNAVSKVDSSLFGPVTESMKKLQPTYVGLKRVQNGRVSDPDVHSAVPAENYSSETKRNYDAGYYLSEDYRVAILGDRLFVNERYIDSQTNSTMKGFSGRDDKGQRIYYYQIVNAAVQPVAFYVGRNFKIAGLDEDYLLGSTVMPSITITGFSSDGTVTAQFGPIIGVPYTLTSGSNFGIASTDVIKNNSPRENKDPDLSSSKLETTMGVINKHSRANLLQYAKDLVATKGGSKIKWTGEVVEYPILAGLPDNSTRYGVYTGNGKLRVYSPDSNKNEVNTYTLSTMMTNAQPFSMIRDRVAQSLEKGGVTSTEAVDKIETYIKITFSAYDYTVVNGVLRQREQTTISDLFSPTLFTSMNDLIIEQMLFDSEMAIPINQMPQGAILQVGTGHYIAANADEKNKIFVGLTPLTNNTLHLVNPSVQDAAYSLANHFIRGGNQYINVAHYLTKFEVLTDASSGETAFNTWASNISTLAKRTVNNKVGNLKATYAALAGSGRKGVKLSDSTDAIYGWDSAGFVYAPVIAKFSNVLMVYPAGDTSTANPRYKLCNFTKNSMSGNLSKLPFWSDDVLSAGLKDWSATVISSGYTKFSGANKLMQAIKDEFREAFAGDLFTLARMLVFIVLIWLFVMSWVCYGFYFGRLMPVVDAIAHPTGNRTGKGIDIFRIVTLGTISVDSEFKLGRFLQYDFIIAILILVVWKSGNITF